MTMIKIFDHYMDKIDRPGVAELRQHLEQCGYFFAPSSSQYHGAEEGGNLRHSLMVTELALQLHKVLCPGIPEESVIICGLFHDLGKADYFNKPQYVPNMLKKGQSGSKPFTTNTERLPIPHQYASLHILGKYIQLTEEEAYAIMFHNGLYTPDGRVIQGKETQLLLLIHWADMWSSRFMEGGFKPKPDGVRF